MTKLLAIAAATGLMVTASAASAQAVNVTNVAFTPGSVTANIHSAPFNGDAGVGRFEFKGNYVSGGAAFDFLTYCVDLSKYVSLGNVNYTNYSIMPLSAMASITATKADALNALLTNATPLLNAASGQAAINISAATQMAVWEVMFETQASWSVTNAASGFYLTTPGGSSATNTAAVASAQSLANGYLNNIAANVWTSSSASQLKLLYSPTQQSQIFMATAPVPEPATWAMMLFGFGGLGYAMRRRRAASPRIRFA